MSPKLPKVLLWNKYWTKTEGELTNPDLRGSEVFSVDICCISQWKVSTIDHHFVMLWARRCGIFFSQCPAYEIVFCDTLFYLSHFSSAVSSHLFCSWPSPRVISFFVELHSCTLDTVQCVVYWKEHPKCKELLDTDSCGSGVFLPELEQPDLCNAQSTSVFELHLLMVRLDDVTSVFRSSHRSREVLKLDIFI